MAPRHFFLSILGKHTNTHQERTIKWKYTTLTVHQTISARIYKRRSTLSPTRHMDGREVMRNEMEEP